MDKERRTYAGMVSALDDAVLRIERTFTTAGIWNQTLLVFTTDNGGPLGSANNFPLRGHKSTAWEGGVRGVAFVRGTHDPVLDALGFRVPPHSRTLELMH
jgi:arylsulfatase B